MVLPTPPEGLRHWRLTDAPALTAAWSDDSVRLWNPPPDDADAASWISRCEERWSLGLSIDFVIDVDGTVGGEVGLRNFTTDPERAELGVWVSRIHRRQGLGLASVRSVTQWSRDELRLDQIWSRVRPTNDAAQALFVTAGWDRLGQAGDHIIFCC